MLTPEELRRYARHLNLPDFGIEAQLKLKQARVLVIGAGGLGSPVLLYLAAAGVGHIGIVEYDKVDESNLQRQILYSTEDIGKSKAVMARKRLLEINPLIEVDLFETSITRFNALEIIRNYDVVADGTDNFPTRYLVNDACVLTGKPNVCASIFRYEGQLSVFNLPGPDGSFTPNYRDLYPQPPAPDAVPNCAEGGVLGVLPGILGSMQANEVIKIITGIGKPLAGRLCLVDTADFTIRTLKYFKRPEVVIDKLIDYEAFCAGPSKTDDMSAIKQMNVKNLKEQMDNGESITLIDVREVHEREAFNIGGLHIPMGEIPANANEVPDEGKVVVYCRSGVRSANVIAFLQQHHGFENLYNLEGGMVAWQETHK
jgi:molybdopterin/thiamine biosynthesis adenylyltransferase/rhodanese-related sulfurtransferase